MGEIEKKRLSKKSQVLLTVAFFAFFGLAIYAGTQIFFGLRDYAVSAQEYDKLREMYEPPEVTAADTSEPVTLDTDDPPETEEEEAAPAEPQPTAPPPPPRDPAEVNAEYIGWLKIGGANISYPVVKGKDNDKYLITSFEGHKSKLGAIFMDYRCSGTFQEYHSIVYGHNAKNGSMFGSLSKYMSAAFLEKNREIIITLPDGRKETWRIFAARKSDINDPSIRLSFSNPESFASFAQNLGAPKGVSRLLTLATCTSGGSKDERMLIHAAMIDAGGEKIEEGVESTEVEENAEVGAESTPVEENPEVGDESTPVEENPEVGDESTDVGVNAAVGDESPAELEETGEPPSPE